MVLNSPQASLSQILVARKQNETISASSIRERKDTMGAESKGTAKGTAPSTDVFEDDSRQSNLQSRDEKESSPIISMRGSKNLEKCPSRESNSTEDCTVADDDSAKSAILSQLEQKRLALRNQRFSLEQRLYEFGTHYSINFESDTRKPNRQVQDMKWQDKKTGMSVLYSGPLTEEEEPHGSGVLKFLDGQIYEGEIWHGVRCGHGTNTWPDGQNYCGEWSENSRNGKGRHSWEVPGGGQKVVTGEWRRGRLHGRISFSWPDGSSFDGIAMNGKRHGRGEHRWSCGKFFRGHYENGKAHGYGALTSPDGTYRGQWKCGLKEGYGTMLWKTRVYSGEWLKDKPHGQGRVVWHNGSTYTGQFSMGRYDGVGVYVWPSGKKVVARWENGVKETSEYCVWPDGTKYDGECDSDGKKHGYGELTWSNGSSYIGAFHRNVRQGRGKLIGTDGEVIYDGLWQSNEPIDCSMEDIMNQLVVTELGSHEENDTNVDEFFTCPQRGSSENAIPKSTQNDGSKLETQLQPTGKSRK
ncbi:unnamed protein product [Cylindrotheca closterium]|uniref:MORN repeat-containing protein 5 n=1 Tax=Cylindrotheca closterium TaxID=2856 RepID=A0AAD2GDI3_9STRA|nr:unnamed protein product [Cylindrotheca closterium]